MSVTRDEWDEQCSRWRWPDGENFVVYPLGEGCVRVLDECTGVTWQVLNKEVNIDSGVPQLYRAAARDYFKAHEPKPWQEAKPGEVWVFRLDGHTGRFVVDCDSEFCGVTDEDFAFRSVPISYEGITDARRIWPEVD